MTLGLALLRDPTVLSLWVAQVRSVWGASRHKPALHWGKVTGPYCGSDIRAQ